MRPLAGYNSIAGVSGSVNIILAVYTRMKKASVMTIHLPPAVPLSRDAPASSQQGNRAVILAEEWHTVDAVLHLDWLLRMAGVRHQVKILWNANNTFAFERIDWGRLAQAAIITTVSRYMKHLMQGLGVKPLVIPNGLSADTLLSPQREAVATFKSRVRGRTVVSKVARWEPDKVGS